MFADNTHAALNPPGYADLDRVLRGTGLRAFRARERLLHEVRREPEDDDVLEVVVVGVGGGVRRMNWGSMC